MRTQLQKAEAFRALHARAEAFIIPNPWDVGTAKMLAKLGFEALATTSAGFAFSIGVLDNQVGRERMLAHVTEIAAATDLPVSADLRSEEHTSELQSQSNLVCRLLLEKKKNTKKQ